MSSAGSIAGLGRLGSLAALSAASMGLRGTYVLQDRDPYEQLQDIRRAIAPRLAGERRRAIVNRSKVQAGRKANVARLRAARA